MVSTDLVKSTKSRKRKFSSNISDPVADLLTRIRNANLAYKDELIAPISKLAESILRILEQEGYIDGFDREGEQSNGAAGHLKLLSRQVRAPLARRPGNVPFSDWPRIAASAESAARQPLRKRV